MEYKLYIEKVNSLPKLKKRKRWNFRWRFIKIFEFDIDITSELNLKKLEESKINFDKMKQEQKKMKNY